jgi:hypothetical protein
MFSAPAAVAFRLLVRTATVVAADTHLAHT